jgi:hypothetical protein
MQMFLTEDPRFDRKARARIINAINAEAERRTISVRHWQRNPDRPLADFECFDGVFDPAADTFLVTANSQGGEYEAMASVEHAERRMRTILDEAADPSVFAGEIWLVVCDQARVIEALEVPQEITRTML